MIMASETKIIYIYMEKLRKIFGVEVNLKSSHFWMIALGIILALAFLVNCGIYPFYKGCTAIDTDELILVSSIFAGLGTARQIALFKFKYLATLHPSTDGETSDAEQILKERLWVPAIGWFLTIGFAVNMLVIPFCSSVRSVDWGFLESSLAIFLTLSGAREYGIYSQNKNKKARSSDKEES